MICEEVAQLHFQKAESARTSFLNYNANTKIGMLLASASIFFSSSFLEIVTQWYGGIGALILFIIVIRTFTKQRRYFKMKYDEYKTEYIKFYAIPYVEAYVDSFGGKPVFITKANIDELTIKMHNDTDFDSKVIKNCIVLHCNKYFKKG